MKRKFIINPQAGGGKVLKEFSRIRNHFIEKTGEFNYAMSGSGQDITEQTRHALKQGYRQIVVLGGDGSLNASVNGFFENGKKIREDALLALSKWGTGCDYFRTVFRNSSNRDWKETVLNYTPKRIDLGEIRFERRQSRFFLNVASVGLSAVVARKKEANPTWLPDALSYFYPTLTSLKGFQPVSSHVIWSENHFRREKEASVLGVFVCKGVYAGGGMRFGGGVSVDDGLFDVKVFEAMPFFRALTRLPKLYTGNFKGVPEVHSFKTDWIAIRSETPLLVECEGEVFGETPVEIMIRPGALDVCWPSDF